jgi:hypothetical protein
MGERQNAISELTRFWLQAKNKCLIYESLPVPVPYNQSDIDFLAVKGNMEKIELPGNIKLGPYLIVETKDEHDWEPKGKEFAKLFVSDIDKMEGSLYVPEKTQCKFTMLRQEHYAKANEFFGNNTFDRLFVLHAIDKNIFTFEIEQSLNANQIYIITISEIVEDLYKWYKTHKRCSGLRNSMTGDMWHLLVGFCGFKPPPYD